MPGSPHLHDVPLPADGLPVRLVAGSGCTGCLVSNLVEDLAVSCARSAQVREISAHGSPMTKQE